MIKIQYHGHTSSLVARQDEPVGQVRQVVPIKNKLLTHEKTND